MGCIALIVRIKKGRCSVSVPVPNPDSLSSGDFGMLRRHARRPADRVADVNKLSPADRAVHAWYRFVLSFPPHLVRDYVDCFGLDGRHVVLDPFCGTGTTLVECKKLGIASIGIESNPMAHFATKVKTDWSPDAVGLEQHAGRVATRATSTIDSECGDDVESLPLFPHASDNGKTTATSNFKRLMPEQEKLLLKNSISPLPLHKTLVLLETLGQDQDARYLGHEQLALANAVVHSISNLHFGPEVGVGPARRDAAVVGSWLRGMHAMARDLRDVRSQSAISAVVHRGDARGLSDKIAARSVDAVITSPPYPNEKDYTRTTRLESVLLGFVRDRSDLRNLKEGLIRSNTRNVFKDDCDDQWVSQNHAVLKIAEMIEARRLELGKTSGFERLYHRVAKLYFGGMARHFAELRHVLRPGARLAYVVGDQASYLRVMIRTGRLLAEIALSLGYELVAIDLFRTRRATATRENLREEVLLLRWPG